MIYIRVSIAMRDSDEYLKTLHFKIIIIIFKSSFNSSISSSSLSNDESRRIGSEASGKDCHTQTGRMHREYYHQGILYTFIYLLLRKV